MNNTNNNLRAVALPGLGMARKPKTRKSKQQKQCELAEAVGINPFVRWEDVWQFGDPHGVGKIWPDLEERIRTRMAEVQKRFQSCCHTPSYRSHTHRSHEA